MSISTILTEAESLVNGPRNETYGHPHHDFNRIASLWSVILNTTVTPQQAVMCMIAVKISRELYRPKRDNAVDIAGYAACLDAIQTYTQSTSTNQTPTAEEPLPQDLKDSLASVPPVTPEMTQRVAEATQRVMKEIEEEESIAPGNNPKGLTNEQVGVQDEYRLLDEDEIKPRRGTPYIQAWIDGCWYERCWRGASPVNTYRTKLSRKEVAKLP